MSESFKVQKMFMSTQKTALNKKSLAVLQQNYNHQPSQFNFEIKSLKLLNYNSQTLIQIIGLIFQSQQNLHISPPYKQIQNVLKIVIFSSNDKQIIKLLQSLLQKNLHKKKQIFILACLWSKYCNIAKFLTLFSHNGTLYQSLTSIIKFVYLSHTSSSLQYFESFHLKNQIHLLLQPSFLLTLSQHHILKLFSEIQTQYNFISHINNKILSKIMLKLIMYIKRVNFNQNNEKKLQINRILLNELRKLIIGLVKKNYNLMQNIIQTEIQSIIKQYSQIKFNNLLQNLCTDLYNNILFSMKENHLNKELQQIIQKLIHQYLNKIFKSDKNKIFSLIQIIFGYKKQSNNNFQLNKSYTRYLQLIIKSWLLSQNLLKLYQIFTQYYQNLRISYKTQTQLSSILQKRSFMLQFLSKLIKLQNNDNNNNNHIQQNIKRIFITKYFYQFLQGLPINFVLQLNYLQCIQKNINNEFLRQQKQNLMKGLKNIKNQKQFNVIIFNKNNFFSSLNSWENDDSFENLMKKSQNNSHCKKILKKFEEYWNVIAQKMLKDNKKIQLLFTTIKISINNKLYYLTFTQLVDFLKRYFSQQQKNNQQKHINNLSPLQYQSIYRPFPSKQLLSKSIIHQKPQSQHPIIIQAKIIKLMKKHLKRATCEQISKKINIPLEKTQLIVKKLVTKGYLQEKQGETYQYQP